MKEPNYATLSSDGRYTKFSFDNRVITFMHGKDLIKYVSVKEWNDGNLVVDCLGKVKGIYEDYIDLIYILENLYMEPEKCLKDVKGVKIEYAG